MDQSALVSLMVELFMAIRLLSAYPAPAVLPEVHSVPQSEIQHRLCESRPCRIKAFYHPDWGAKIFRREFGAELDVAAEITRMAGGGKNFVDEGRELELARRFVCFE